MTSSPLRGLIPVLSTPMNADESLDEAGFEKLVNYVIDEGFEGIWALATAGEEQNMTQETIEEAARLLVKYNRGRIPLLVKTSRPGLKDTIEYTRRMADIGFEAAVIHCEHKLLAADHVRRFYFEAAEASPLPVYIYQNPHRGAEYHIDLLVELAAHPNVVGIKAAGSDLSYLQPMCLLNPPDFAVFTAGGGQILAGLAMGATGHTANPVMMFPRLARSLYDHVQAGRLPEARDAQRTILQFLRRLPKMGNREMSAETKAVLEIRGIAQRHVSAPFRSATDAEVAQIASLLDELQIS